MTELEKMAAGAPYCFTDAGILESCRRGRERLDRFNATRPGEAAYGEALAELLPRAAGSAMVVPPFYCEHGTAVELGEGVFVNARCTMLDGGGIRIGARTKIGPDCKFYTPQHPTDYLERRKPEERALRIEIGADCWLGGNVTVCPGVRIGDRTIVAAGSVVPRDLPDDVLAAGTPAVIKRQLT